MKSLFAKIIIILVPALALGILAYHDVSPNGERAVRYEMGERSPFVFSPLPSERVSDVVESDAGAYVTMVDEPVYISVEPPGSDYESVRVELAFDPHDQPIVELGGLVDIQAYAFDFRPMANGILERLDWPRVAESQDGMQTVLFAREEVNAAIDDFLAFPPERSAIATYRASLTTPYRMEDYMPLGSTRHVDVSLRGSHEFLTYVKDEDVALSVAYSDVNRTYGADEGAVRIWRHDGTLMAEKVLTDDGNISEDQLSARSTIMLSGEDWDEGVYRVELSGTSDIIWRSIDTSLRYVTFKNRLYIADEVGYRSSERATSFVTNARRLTLETFHAESPDEVTIGEQTVAISQTHTKVTADVGDGELLSGVTPAGDIKMTTEGKFALSADMFFDPDPVGLTPFTDLDQVSYVYATMAVPSAEGGWRTADATFDLSSLVVENGAYKFAISTPGLKELGTSVDLHAVEFTFIKPPMSVGGFSEEFARRWWRALKAL